MPGEKEKKTNEFNEMSLDELQEKKKQVAEFLANLEDEYRNAAITEESYKQAKGSNAKKFELIKKKLEEFGIVDTNTPPPAPPAQKPSGAEDTVPPEPAPKPVETVPSEEPAPPAAPVPHPSAISKLAAVFGIGRKDISASPVNPQSPPAAAPPAPLPVFQSQPPEPQIRKLEEKFAVDLERIRATLDAMKEARTALDEKVQRMTESVAELRSMIFQRETTMKNYDIKLEKMSEAMADIEPQKIAKEFSKRDKTEGDIQIRIEKLERKSEDMMKTISETNALIKSVGGLQNIADVDREIAKKMARIEELTKSVERLSEKTEKMFVEINKNLEEFILYKVRQENIETMVEDLMKTSDKTGIRFENYLEKKELAAFREGLNTLQKQFELWKKYLKKAVPFIEAEIPKELLELQRQREDIQLLIASLRAEYEQKKIPESDYNTIIEKNQAKLAEIDKKLSDTFEKFREGGGSPSEVSGAKEKASAEEKSDAKEKNVVAPQEKKIEIAQSAPMQQLASVDFRIDTSQTPQKQEQKPAPQASKPAPIPPAAPAPSPPPVQSPPPAMTSPSIAPEIPQTAAKKLQPSLATLAQAGAGKEEPQEKPAAVQMDSNALLSELEASFRQGLITKEAYEHTKRLLSALL